MDLHKASYLAKQLLDQHGLTQTGWIFRYGKSVNTLGFCDYRNRHIVLSLSHTALGTEDRVRNTILHEIAHALVGPYHDHNHVWRQKAIEIGCNGERCTKTVGEERPQRKWSVVCTVHGEVRQVAMNVRGARPRSCGRCSPYYDERYLLKTVPNPKYHEQRRTIANAAQRAF